MKLKKLFSIFLLTVIMGCQSQPVSEQINDVTVGSILTLHQRLAIPINTAHVYLQHGKTSSAGGVSRFYPNCSFSVNDVSDGKQFIEAGVYRVTEVNHYRRPFGLGGIGGVLVAGPFVGQLFNRNAEIDYITEMRLSSDTPNEIRRFMCKITDDSSGRYLTLKDIREALGSLATLKSAGSEAS